MPTRLLRHPRADERQRPQYKVIGIEILRPPAFDALDLGRPEARFDRADRAEGDLVLEREDVVERAVVAFPPDMHAGLGFDQLRGDADPFACLAHRPSEHIERAQLAADSLHIDSLALRGEARIAGDHEEPADAAQAGDDVLDHPVGEIFLLGVGAQALERHTAIDGLSGTARAARLAMGAPPISTR